MRMNAANKPMAKSELVIPMVAMVNTCRRLAASEICEACLRMGLPDSEGGEVGVKVVGLGMKSGSLSDLNRGELSPVSTRAERSSLVNKSFQSTSPTLVMAVESMIFAPVLGAAANRGALAAEDVFAFGLGSTVVGAAVGTAMGSLHFGQGSVWPSNCSCRTTILLEQ